MKQFNKFTHGESMLAVVLRQMGIRMSKRYRHSSKMHANLDNEAILMQMHDQVQAYQHNFYPDERGRYGSFGGKFVPESLMVALAELEVAYEQARNNSEFQAELQRLLSSFRS